MVESKASDSGLSALLLGEFENDREIAEEVFRKAGWRLFEARDLNHARRLLELHLVHVVVAESVFPAGNWKMILEDLGRRTQPPQLVVASRIADEYLWAEVLNVGGYDVLPRPFESDELARVVASAWRHFWRQPIQSVRRSNGSLYSVA